MAKGVGGWPADGSGRVPGQSDGQFAISRFRVRGSLRLCKLSRQSRKHRPPIHWERSLELTIHWENEEDVMGRLVVGTGEEVGGKACFFVVFSTFLVALGEKNQPKSQQKSKPKKKTKNNKKVTKK